MMRVTSTYIIPLCPDLQENPRSPRYGKTHIKDQIKAFLMEIQTSIIQRQDHPHHFGNLQAADSLDIHFQTVELGWQGD